MRLRMVTHDRQATDRDRAERKRCDAGCAEAGTNCALHHRCIRALVREGVIERIGREYVFKEQ